MQKVSEFCIMENEIKNIVEKVAKLFLKFGIKSVSMDDIARELSMSKKTLYQYFKDKEELIKTIIHVESEKKKCFFEGFKDKGMNAVEESLEVYKIMNEYVKEITPVVEYDLRKYYPKLHKELSDFRAEQIQKTVKENLKKGKEEGVYRQDFDIDIIAKLHILRLTFMLNEEYFTAEEYKKAFSEVFFYHMRGICSREGIKILEEKLR